MKNLFQKKYTLFKRNRLIKKLKTDNYKFLYGEQKTARKFVVILAVALIIYCLLCCFVHSFYMDIATSLFSNSFFIGIASSIFGIIILYIINNYYCKYMIKKDVRCNEIMENLSIMSFILADHIFKNRQLFNDDVKIDIFSDNISEFMSSTYKLIEFNATSLASDNNLILIQSLETSFLTNINFKLLNIINNIKNRYPNINKDLNSISKNFNKWKKQQDNNSLNDLIRELWHFKVDVFFLIKYWLTLLDYLKFDYINKWENDDHKKYTKKQYIEIYKYLFELPNSKKIYDAVIECKKIIEDAI